MTCIGNVMSLTFTSQRIWMRGGKFFVSASICGAKFRFARCRNVSCDSSDRKLSANSTFATRPCSLFVSELPPRMMLFNYNKTYS